MPPAIPSNNEILVPVKDMGYSLELKRSSRQPRTSKVVKEKIVSSHANKSLEFQDKRKVESLSGQSYLHRNHELRKSAGDVQSSGNHPKQWIGSKSNKDDELVKHMSNLPDYLQRAGRGKNIQEKALNFGVLDWAHLEKWKYNQKHIPPRGKAIEPSSCSNSSFMASGSSSLCSTVQSKSVAPQRKQTPLRSSHLNSTHEGISRRVKQSQGKFIQLQDLKTASKSTLDMQRNLRRTDEPSGRKNSIESDQKTTSEKDTSLPGLRKHEVSLAPKDMMSGETKPRVEELQASDFDPEQLPVKPKSIILLLPKHSHKKSCSQLSESRTLFDGKLTQANWKSFAEDFSSPEVHPEELSSEIPYSCPQPVIAENNTQSDKEPHSLISARGMEFPRGASHICPCSNESPTILSKGKSVVDKNSSTKPSNTDAIETSRTLGQETAEPVGAKGRQTSLDRFSFSLGRMSRSFSLKENSSIPRLGSSFAAVKSGSIRSEASDSLDNSNENKSNVHNRARSSSLRWLLDPLLKPKAANPHLSSKTVGPLKENLNSSTFRPESLQDKKHEASTIEALVQLTIKNGFPLFKLVVDKNSDTLAATMKKLTTSAGKDDSSWIYTFYSVYEIKKKSGSWINQGHKKKGCGFGYNIIGQMKVSSSHFPDLIVQSFKDQFAVRECVLYGVDLRQADQEAPEFMPMRELAAIVIKIPGKNSNDNKEQSNKGVDFTRRGITGCLWEDRNDWNKGKIANSSSTIVILPGGIHSLPNKGKPSPLVNRWRTGGSCDCGGWDVGCELRILTSQDQSCKHSGPSTPCSTPDHLDLFAEGEAQENRPIFSLAPFKKGIYSVEFETSISLLQAFSICIASISSQKSFDISEVNNLSEAKLLQESAFTRCDRLKSPMLVQGEVPAKFVPSPPPSPIGRV
ncbi:hypothetical protein F0562_016256 [Nyssa sinensis]|uniref:DUF3527 domain-containing protein n=1 Tax=Nyssa sinensis TaxID=561372 RepID=A0A5J4ZJW6_9ASTE|nr:hypothetical protein F0562_016256 [Nyssa sinensis]